MNQENLCLLDALRAFAAGEKLAVCRQYPDLNWEQLFTLAETQSVTGILCYLLINDPEGVPEQILQSARYQYHATIQQFMIRGRRMEGLIKKLNDAEIDHLLFKGFVLKNYYPIPELRTYGDIDFLIRPEDRAKCHGLMLDNGYTSETNWEPVYSYGKGSEYYEIHTDVMEVDVSNKADYKAYFQHIWEHAENRSGHTWYLTPEFHLLYLLTHIAKHISASGAGIRMYLDIAIFVEKLRDTIDWHWVGRELETLQFVDFANMVFTLVERYLGVESPIPLRPIDDGVLEDFMEYTLEAGVFGHYNRDSGLVTLKKQNEDDETVLKGAALMERLFPSAKSIETRYTYLQKNPWLLPVAWVHRFVRTSGDWEKHKQEMESILSADDEAVLKMKRIRREIGL